MLKNSNQMFSVEQSWKSYKKTYNSCIDGLT